MIVISVLHYGDISSTISCVQSICNDFSEVANGTYRICIPTNGTCKENCELEKWARTYCTSFTKLTAESITEPQDFSEVFFSDLQVLADVECILIVNEKNVGFAAGHNPSINLALQLGAEAVWLLNNDSIVHSGTLSSLWDYYKGTDGRSIIGTTVVGSTDPEIVQCAGGMRFNPYITSVTPSFSGNKLKDIDQIQLPEFDYIFGASILVPAQAFKEVGLLNEDFFLFYEEIDFCRRAKSTGYSLGWCKKAIIQHCDISEKGDSEVRIFHDVRSFTLFAKKHYPTYWFLMACIHMAGRGVMQVKEKNVKAAFVAVKGLLQGINDAVKLKLISFWIQ